MANALVPFVDHNELEVIQRTGKMLAASGYFDASGDSIQAIAQMATKIMAGRELGFGPFASVNGIHIVQKKPAIGANLMASAVKSSGRYDYRVRKMDNDGVQIEFLERMGDKWESLGISEFTRQDATAAGTQNMAKFGRNMMFARAMSNGVRWYTPDVFNGNAVYVPEELGATVDGEGNVIEVVGRKVDTSTGEVQPLADENFYHDNPFEDSKPEPVIKDPITPKTLQRLNTVGAEFYNGKGEWDATRPQLVGWVTQGAETSSKNLTENEGKRLISAIERKREKAQAAEHAAEQAELSPA